jgi:hypothetical protein
MSSLVAFSCSNVFLNGVERGLFLGYFWWRRLFLGVFGGWHACELFDVGVRVL